MPTTYYIRKTGSDSNAGTSAGAAWLTIGKALGASGMASGDTVYVGAGVYRESVTVAMTSAVAETFVVADVDGSKTGDVGEVRWTAYGTNDTSVPGNTTTLNLSGRDFLAFQKFVMVGGSSSLIDATTATSTNCKLQDCTLISGVAGAGADHLIAWTNASGTAANWTVERCVLMGFAGEFIKLTLTFTGVSDYDLAFTIRNCLLLGGGQASLPIISTVVSGGSILTGAGSGPAVQNCTILMGGTGDAIATGASISASQTCKVKNCVILGGGLNASSAGQIVEDYNHIVAGTARTNVSTGTHSKTGATYSTLLEVGQALQQGRQHRLFMTPSSDSPYLGFDNDSTPTALTIDFLNRPRPSGSGPSPSANAKNAIGYLERHDYGVKEASVVDTSSTYSVKMTGPGDWEVQVPVDASSTTVTVRVRFDTNYAGSLPQAILLDNAEIGVSTETKTATGSADAWSTLTFSAFTPSAKGWVTIRLYSRSTAGNGLTYWDTFTVA